MAKKTVTPFQQELIDTVKKISEYKLSCEANITAIIYLQPELLYETDLELSELSNNTWRVYWAIANDIIKKENKKVLDDMTIGFYLEKHPKLKAKYDEYGGYETIEKAGSYVKVENLYGYIGELRKWNSLMKMAKNIYSFKDNLSNYCDMSSDDIYNEQEAILNHIFINADEETKSYSIDDGIDELIEELNRGTAVGLPYHDMPLLNKETGGQLTGNITLIGGLSNMGKTTLARSLCIPTTIKNGDKLVIMLNEEGKKKWQRELLVWVANNIYKFDLQKFVVRDGKYSDEVMEILRKCADWIKSKASDNTITIIPFNKYRTDKAIKVIKKYRIMNDRLDDVDLNKTKGIKDYTFNVIKQKVIENFKLADLVEEFRGLFSLSIIKKLYDKYPSVEKIKEVIRTEPYECLCRLNGIGFKTADGMLLELEKESRECKEIGKNPILFFGFDLKPSYQRAKACVDYILNENETNGNTYVKVGELKKQFEILVPEAISNLPTILKADNDVIFDRESLSVCRKETYETEKYIADKIKEGLSINTEWNCDCSQFRSLDGFDLTTDQCKTSEFMCKHNIVMLVGYGGSGKSSSTQAFVNLLKHYNKSFLLLAPTGRAAKVLAGFTGENAMTIHRGLGYMPPNDWYYNQDNPVPYDVVIVDEFSMVDIFLMRKLLEAIDFNRTKLLLIGDDAQIPSVGAGNVLYDLLCYNNIPTVTLDKIFRYGKGGLSTVATDTRTGTEYLDKTKHPMLAAEWVRNTKVEHDIPSEYKEMIAGMCEAHSGEWTTNKRNSVVLPEPRNDMEFFIHECDILSSRADLDMIIPGKLKEILSGVKTEEISLEEYRVDFGKHSGRTLLEIRDIDPGYIRWMKEKVDREPVKTLLAQI